MGDYASILFKDSTNLYGPITEILENGIRIGSNFYLYSDIQTINSFSFKIGETIQITYGYSDTPNEFGMLTSITDDGLKLDNSRTYTWSSIKLVKLFEFKNGDYVCVNGKYYGLVTSTNTNGLTLSLNNNNLDIKWYNIYSITLSKQEFNFNLNDWIKITTSNSTYLGSISKITPNYLTITSNSQNYNIAWNDIEKIEPSIEFKNGDLIKVISSNSIYYGFISSISLKNLSLTLNNNSQNFLWNDVTTIDKIDNFLQLKTNDFVKIKTISLPDIYGVIKTISPSGLVLDISNNSKSISWSEISNILPVIELGNYVEIRTSNELITCMITNFDKDSLFINTSANIPWSDIKDIKLIGKPQIGDWVVITYASSTTLYYGEISNINLSNAKIIIKNNNTLVELSFDQNINIEWTSPFPFKIDDYVQITTNNTTNYTGWIGNITIYLIEIYTSETHEWVDLYWSEITNIKLTTQK